MLTTLETFHAEMFWLKVVAEANIAFMLTTLETSHAEMLELKERLLKNKLSILVTAETFQLLMSPYAVVTSS
jgi:hypothetical protein